MDYIVGSRITNTTEFRFLPTQTLLLDATSGHSFRLRGGVDADAAAEVVLVEHNANGAKVGETAVMRTAATEARDLVDNVDLHDMSLEVVWMPPTD